MNVYKYFFTGNCVLSDISTFPAAIQEPTLNMLLNLKCVRIPNRTMYEVCQHSTKFQVRVN